MLDQVLYDTSETTYDASNLFYNRYTELIVRTYEALGPWSRADSGGELLEYVRALVSTLSHVDEIVRDTDTHDGWGRLLDVDAAPSWALPWLAQFVGVDLIGGSDDETQRIRIKGAAGFYRGTPSAIIAAARQRLTGQRRVELYEREGGPWTFRLRTYLSETPNSVLVREAVEALKPAGCVFLYEVQNGVEINGLAGTIEGLAGSIQSYSNVLPS